MGDPDLVVASTPVDRWLRAVALGGRGRYAAASTLLATLLADPATPAAVAAHAAVTLASHRRQQGGHAAARLLDAQGLRLACACRGGPAPDGDGTDALAARVDALVGLAADALGLGDPAAGRLLDAAEGIDHPSWRPRVRSGWVRAELALFAGRAAEAVEPAERAMSLARAADAPRHVLKSRLVLAVARAAVHPDGVALGELDAVADDAEGLGRLPLVWPARLAAADVVDRSSRCVSKLLPSANDPRPAVANESVSGPTSGAARRRHAAMATLSALYQLSDPLGRRLMGESMCVPTWSEVT